MEIIIFAINKPLLGVCLGHQAIAEYFGASLINLDNVNHGISTEISIIKDDCIFNDINKKTNVGLYHSWVIDRNNFPNCLDITSVSKKRLPEIIELKNHPWFIGVQFHPESILTESGLKMIENWIRN